MSTLSAVPAALRTGAMVVAHDGSPAEVWESSGTHVRLVRDQVIVADDEGHEWFPAKTLTLIEPHPIGQPEARRCVRRDHPDAGPDDLSCPTCGLDLVPVEETSTPSVALVEPTAPAMITLDQGEILRDRFGRPVLDGIAYTRASTLAKILDDQSALLNWACRQTALGMASAEDLIAAVATIDPADKRGLDGIVSQAKERAASGRGALLGTAIHSATEMLDRGQIIEGLPEKIRTDALAYRAAIDSVGLVPLAAEMFVGCPDLMVAGSFDRLLQGPTRVLVGDLKTSASADTAKYAALSWATQIAVYAHSLPWLPGQGFVPWSAVGLPEPDRERGLVIHVQQGTGIATLYSIDLEAGWAAAQLAAEVRGLRTQRDLAIRV